jgi:hypothetical protein
MMPCGERLKSNGDVFMSMTPFISRFPELGAQETRWLLVRGLKDLPDGNYGLMEMYCDESGCDCRRVMIAVLRQDTKMKFWATISYGWERLKFYKRWGHFSNNREALECKGPYLDPLNPQTQYAYVFLAQFRIVLESPGYEERLKRHYQMFRATVDGGRHLVESSKRSRHSI